MRILPKEIKRGENLIMGRKSKSEEDSIESTDTVSEPVATEDITTVLLKFEDLTVSQKRVFQQDGSECSIGYTTIIDKTMGGISDHTYNMFASAEQKTWYLYRENEPVLDTGSQRGNRPFHWEGMLTPGLYTFGTGPVPNFSTPKKSRIPGRGYQVKFRI